MGSIAVARPVEATADGVSRATHRVRLFVIVLGALWGLWEGYRRLGIHFGWQPRRRC